MANASRISAIAEAGDLEIERVGVIGEQTQRFREELLGQPQVLRHAEIGQQACHPFVARVG